MNRFKRSMVLVCLILTSGIIWGQKTKSPTSGEIYEDLKKLNVLASVLYVAAHPDDENTRLISYLSNEVKAQTTYLSLTRGDGGQNLIGKEFDEKLGVLRTQELLMARSIDKGKQMFTRANDFGYSKNAEETIEIWDTEKIKADVTWAIRSCKPDVIINRFDHRTSGKTHGHHTASAMLSYELFDKTGLASFLPRQLEWVSPWQARRLFFNTSWWFYGSQENFDKADKSKLMGFDVGTYFPVLGKSNTEIAAESRSQHKCQGFGSTGTRGSQMEYLELIAGDMPANKENIFEGINTTWTRVKGGDKIQPLVEAAIARYSFTNPSLILPDLLNIFKQINRLDDGYWKKIKLEECARLIKHCSGLFIEVKANSRTAAPGDDLVIEGEIIKRLPSEVTLTKIHAEFFKLDTLISSGLDDNSKGFYSFNVKIPWDAHYSTPYWLWKKGITGMYEVDHETWIGMPETPSNAQLSFTCAFGDQQITFTENVVYKFNSPENGETYRPFAVIPPVGVNFSDKVFLFPDSKSKKVFVDVTAYSDSLSGNLFLNIPDAWTCEPKSFSFHELSKGQSRRFNFNLTPPAKAQIVEITPVVEIGDKKFSDALEPINYDHIPHQFVQQEAQAKCVKLEVAIPTLNIGYISGAGDDIGDYLQKLGFSVTYIHENDIVEESLERFDCVISGIRAYNTLESLKYKHATILEYVKKGGKFVMLYNTANGLITSDLGPYPFKISRDRVTVETAEMSVNDANHPILHHPNEITTSDFDGWVQERGLYFASELDPKYTGVFSCQDPGESPKNGALIHSYYGKGEFIYTGLSFFRQFPAGVPGAYRLFVNMITPSPRP